MIYGLLRSISKNKPAINGFNKRFIETALMVFFLGILNAVRLSRASSINIKETDIINFLKISIENSMDIKI